MARSYNVIFMDGFDMYNFDYRNTTNPSIHSKWVLTGSDNVTGPAGRYGGKALHMGDSIYGNNIKGYWPSNTYYQTGTFAFAYLTYNVTQAESHGRFFNVLHDQGDQFGIGVSNIGEVRLYRGNTIVANSIPNLIKTNDWHYMEMEYVGNTNSGRASLYLDGVKVVEFTGNTQNQAPFGFNGVQFSGGSSNGYLIDDLYVIDQATRIGERRIDTLRPNGDVTGNAFKPNDGNLTNFNMLNESTVDPTNYVTANVLGAKDLYNFDNLTTVPTAIDAVQLSVWAQKTDSDTRQLATIFKSGTTETIGKDTNLPSNHIDIFRIEQQDPSTNADWTATGVNNLQAGFKITK